MAFSKDTIKEFLKEVEDSCWFECVVTFISDSEKDEILSENFWFEDGEFACSSDKADEIRQMIPDYRLIEAAKDLGADHSYERFVFDISDLFDIYEGDMSRLEEVLVEHCEEFISGKITDWIDDYEPEEDEDEEE